MEKESFDMADDPSNPNTGFQERETGKERANDKKWEEDVGEPIFEGKDFPVGGSEKFEGFEKGVSTVHHVLSGKSDDDDDDDGPHQGSSTIASADIPKLTIKKEKVEEEEGLDGLIKKSLGFVVYEEQVYSTHTNRVLHDNPALSGGFPPPPPKDK